MPVLKARLALSNPHTHTQFCDGKSTAEEMAQSALDKGFVSLGFSSHAIQDMHIELSLNETREALYIAEVRRLQEAHKGRLKIWLGMERDRISPADRNKFEYVIGASHYARPEGEGRFPVDGHPEVVSNAVRTLYKGDALTMAEEYFADFAAYIHDYKPDIIAHFDLLFKYNHIHRLIDTRHPRYIKAATDAMDLAVKGCHLLEVNTGGMVRAGTPEPYPSLPLLCYWRAIGGQVTLSSDCHQAAQLDALFEVGIAHIRKAGYKTAAILGGGNTLFETVEVPEA